MNNKGREKMPARHGKPCSESKSNEASLTLLFLPLCLLSLHASPPYAFFFLFTCASFSAAPNPWLQRERKDEEKGEMAIRMGGQKSDQEKGDGQKENMRPQLHCSAGRRAGVVPQTRLQVFFLLRWIAQEKRKEK